jgi:hypothetical protein
MDAPNHQDTVFFFDFADAFGYQPVYGSGDLTRLQRASKGSSESTGGCRDDVIQSGSMRREGVRRYFIVLSDGAVYAKQYRFGFRRQVGAPHRASFALDADFGAIDYVSHFDTIAL